MQQGKILKIYLFEDGICGSDGSDMGSCTLVLYGERNSQILNKNA